MEGQVPLEEQCRILLEKIESLEQQNQELLSRLDAARPTMAACHNIMHPACWKDDDEHLR